MELMYLNQKAVLWFVRWMGLGAGLDRSARIAM
jgi:hypothetical protein